MEGSMAPQQGWWSRNWKWVVPSGCLGVLLSCGCLGALVFGLTSHALRGAGVFTEAVAMATQSPEVREALGEPIEAGMMFQGSIQSTNGRGQAHFTVPLDGSRAEGLLRVEAYKQGDEWRYTTLVVEVPGRPPITLIGGEQAPPTGTVPFPETLPDVEPLPEEEPEDPGAEDIQL